MCPPIRWGAIRPGSVAAATLADGALLPEGPPISTSHAIQVVMVPELEPISTWLDQLSKFRAPSTIYWPAARNVSFGRTLRLARALFPFDLVLGLPCHVPEQKSSSFVTFARKVAVL